MVDPRPVQYFSDRWKRRQPDPAFRDVSSHLLSALTEKLQKKGQANLSPFLTELKDLGQEETPDLFYESLLNLGDRLRDRGYADLAVSVFSAIVHAPPLPPFGDPLPQGERGEMKATPQKVPSPLVGEGQGEGAAFVDISDRARARLDALSGRGHFGRRFETQVSNFISGSTDGAVIGAMLGATLLGKVAGAAAFGRLSATARCAWWTRGIGSRTLSELGAYAVEFPAFAGLSRALTAHAEGPFSDELKRSALALGAMRLFSPASRWIGTQGSAFVGLLASHKLEEHFGLRSSVDDATWVTGALTSLVSMGVGARLGYRALGEGFARFQAELRLRAKGLGKAAKDLSTDFIHDRVAQVVPASPSPELVFHIKGKKGKGGKGGRRRLEGIVETIWPAQKLPSGFADRSVKAAMEEQRAKEIFQKRMDTLDKLYKEGKKASNLEELFHKLGAEAIGPEAFEEIQLALGAPGEISDVFARLRKITREKVYPESRYLVFSMLVYTAVGLSRFEEGDKILREEKFSEDDQDPRQEILFKDMGRFLILTSLLATGRTEGEFNLSRHLAELRSPNFQVLGWQKTLDYLFERNEIEKAKSLVRALKLGGEFKHVSEPVHDKIIILLGEHLRSQNLLPTHEETERVAQEMRGFLKEIVEGSGIPVQKGTEELYLVPIPEEMGSSLDLMLGIVGGPYEKWQVQTRLLSDGRVTVDQKIPDDLEALQEIRGRWMVNPILLSTQDALWLGLVKENPEQESEMELVEPPPEILVYRPQADKPDPLGRKS